jgi:hypothetical protein
VKVKIGTVVCGEIDQGPVVAMSKEWCIYQTKLGEIAEEWASIEIVSSGPDSIVSSIEEKELSE